MIMRVQSVGGPDNRMGENALKKVDMETVASCPRESKSVPFDPLARRIDRALAELHGELIAEPLSPSLLALAKRLTIGRSHS
jgi:hypothetical protein